MGFDIIKIEVGDSETVFDLILIDGPIEEVGQNPLGNIIEVEAAGDGVHEIVELVTQLRLRSGCRRGGGGKQQKGSELHRVPQVCVGLETSGGRGWDVTKKDLRVRAVIWSVRSAAGF